MSDEKFKHLSDEEAKEAYENAEPIPLAEGEVDRIVERVMLKQALGTIYECIYLLGINSSNFSTSLKIQIEKLGEELKNV